MVSGWDSAYPLQGAGFNPGVGTKIPQAKKRKKPIPNNEMKLKGKCCFSSQCCWHQICGFVSTPSSSDSNCPEWVRAHSCGLSETAFLFRWPLKVPALTCTFYQVLINQWFPWPLRLFSWYITEFRKHFTDNYWFTISDTTQEQPKGRDAQGKVWGRGTKLPCALWTHDPPNTSSGFTSSEALQMPLLRVFMEFHYTGMTD